MSERAFREEGTCGGDRSNQVPCRRSDFLQIAVAQGRRIHQFCTHAESEGSGSNEVGGVRCVYPSGWDQASMREGSLQRSQILRSTHVAAGKDLDQMCSVFLSSH